MGWDRACGMAWVRVAWGGMVFIGGWYGAGSVEERGGV